MNKQECIKTLEKMISKFKDEILRLEEIADDPASRPSITLQCLCQIEEMDKEYYAYKLLTRQKILLKELLKGVKE